MRTREQLKEALRHPAVSAFLRVIREGESTNKDDSAYRMRYPGSRFEDLSKHPRIPAPTPNGKTSTAAGAYMFVASTWDGINKKYGLGDDMSPESQDLHAVALLDDVGALIPLLDGDFAAALKKAGTQWASLPGSSLDDGHNFQIKMDRALAVFNRYAGIETQPAAPIESRPEPPRQDTPMAPALFIPILQSLFQVFSPLAQAKISDALNKQTKDQAMSDQMAQQILDIVRNAAATATGTAVATPTAPVQPIPPAQPAPPGTPAAPVPLPPAADAIVQQAAEIERLRLAVAALKSDQAALANAESQVVGYLKSLDPFLDKILERDKVEWAASEESMDRAAIRYAQNPNPDDWMTKTLVIGALGLGASLIALVAGVAIAQVVGSPAREPSTVVWASLTGIIGTVFGIVTTIYAFRFGTTRQSSAKDFTNAAMASELNARRENVQTLRLVA